MTPETLDRSVKLCYPIDMTDILIREIDEELKQERLEKLWKQHGKKLGAVVALLLLGTVAYIGYQGQRAAGFEKATTALATTVQQLTEANEAEVQKSLITVADASPVTIATITRLYTAAMTDTPAEREVATAQLKLLADNSKVPALYRELAQVLSIGLVLDTADAADLQSKLTPLMANDKPWRFMAREYAALLFLKTGDVKAAKPLLEALRDDKEAPNGTRERAVQFLSQIEG